MQEIPLTLKLCLNFGIMLLFRPFSEALKLRNMQFSSSFNFLMSPNIVLGTNLWLWLCVSLLAQSMKTGCAVVHWSDGVLYMRWRVYVGMHCLPCSMSGETREPLGSWAGGIWMFAVLLGNGPWSEHLWTHLNFVWKTTGWSNLKQSEEMTGRMDNHNAHAQIYLLSSPFYLAINVRSGKPWGDHFFMFLKLLFLINLLTGP